MVANIKITTITTTATSHPGGPPAVLTPKAGPIHAAIWTNIEDAGSAPAKPPDIKEKPPPKVGYLGGGKEFTFGDETQTRSRDSTCCPD